MIDLPEIPLSTRPQPLATRVIVRSAVCTGILLTALHTLPALALTPIDSEQQGANGVTGLGAPTTLVVSPDQRHVYVASASSHVVAFAREGTTGTLSFLATYSEGAGIPTGLRQAVSIAMSPEGTHVYVAGLTDGSIVIFVRDAATGRLQFLTTLSRGDPLLPGVERVGLLALSADGAFLHVASHHVANLTAGTPAAADRLLVLRRNAVTGLLSSPTVYIDGNNGIDGLTAPSAMRAAPDGKHVLIASAGDHSLAVFSRNAADGALAMVQLIRNGLNGITGLDAARSIEFDARGRFVYVAGTSEDTLLTLRRDPLSGQLLVSQTLKNNNNGVDGLDGITGIAVDRDSNLVYAASSVDNALAVFTRHPATGALTFVEAVRDAVVPARLQTAGALALAAQPPTLNSLALTSNQIVVWQGPSTDLAVSQQTTPAALRLGDKATITFTLNNRGVTAASQARVLLNWPVMTGLTAAVASTVAPVESVDLVRGEAVINAGTLAAGESRSFTLDLTLVSPTATAATTVTVTTQAFASISDSNNENNHTSTSLVFTVPPPNRVPVVLQDRATTLPNTAVSVRVLDNDTDPDGDRLTLAPATATVSTHGGTLARADDGSVLYTPPAGYFGNDSFVYTVTDGHNGGSATGQVIVTVNTAPTAADDHAVTTPGVAVDINLFANDNDADDGILRLVKTITGSTGGTVTVQGSDHVTFTPALGFHGTAPFSYELADGLGATATANVSVTVNSAPVASSKELIVEPDAVINLQREAPVSDADGDVLQWQFDATAASTLGQFETADGGVSVFRIAADAIGNASIVFTATDAFGAAANGTLQLVVNTLPIANSDEVTTNFETPVTILALYNDEQRDANDQLSLLLDKTDSTSQASGIVSSAITPDGDTTLIYTPPTGFSGDDRFSYTVADQFGKTSQGTVIIHVTLPPPPPDNGTNTPPAPATTDTGDNGGGADIWVGVLAGLWLRIRARSVAKS